MKTAKDLAAFLFDEKNDPQAACWCLVICVSGIAIVCFVVRLWVVWWR